MENKMVVLNTNESKSTGSGYKVIEVNVSDPSENLYAVCTPIKLS